MLSEWVGLLWPLYQAAGGPVVENAVRVAAQDVADGQTWTHLIWLVLAAMAGSVTTLSFRQFRPFTARERAMMVLVGFVFAIFVGPLIVGLVLPTAKSSSSTVGALYYIIAAGAHWLLPWIFEKVFGFRPNDDGGSGKGGGRRGRGGGR